MCESALVMELPPANSSFSEALWLFFIVKSLVLSCLIHATRWANAPRWGEGRSPPTTPIYLNQDMGWGSQALGRAAVLQGRRAGASAFFDHAGKRGAGCPLIGVRLENTTCFLLACLLFNLPTQGNSARSFPGSPAPPGFRPFTPS
jgi:hypothetical protein